MESLNLNINFDFLSLLKNSGFRLASLFVIVVFGCLIIKNIMKMIKVTFVSSSMDNALVNFFLTLIKFFLFMALLMYCLNYIGISLTGIISAISAITLAVMLALQNIISGVAHGIMLATTHPFKVNDFVDVGGVSGTVQEINLMHTVLNTPDGKHVYLPNSSVFTSVITNVSYNTLRRMDVEVKVDYGCDQIAVKELLLKVASAHPLVLSEPAPEDHYNTSNDDGIIHILRIWVHKSDYWTVKFDLDEQTYQALINNNFAVPFKQLTISYREPEPEPEPAPEPVEDPAQLPEDAGTESLSDNLTAVIPEIETEV